MEAFLRIIVLSATLLVGNVLFHGGVQSTSASAAPLEAHQRMQGEFARQEAVSQQPSTPPSVTVRMKKEAVRALWGEPAEVREMRTCFGTREEWVYRGDVQRFGAPERTLHFDEDGVLTEIK